MDKLDLPKATVRLYILCLFYAVGSFVWGYNVGVLASVLAHPGFRRLLQPTASQHGLITGIYYLGTLFSYLLLSRFASDILGRRMAAFAGTAVTCFGTVLIAGAAGRHAFAMVILGRIISGVGVAAVSTSVPLYQSEIAPAKQRGRFVVMNHIGFVAGLAIGFWVGYGMTFWKTPTGEAHGWRVSIALEYIPAIVFMVGLPLIPESPRWLVEHGKLDRAKSSLLYLREGIFSADEIEHEFDEIRQSVVSYRASGLGDWRSLFREPSLRSRLWRATLLQFMAQLCGATAMKYYLPTLLRQLGLSRRQALMVGGLESSLKIVCTVIEAYIIDGLGRRASMALGAAAMGIGMLMNAILPLTNADGASQATNIVCVGFVFVYSLGYSLGFGPAAWVYGSEIFPTALRARGLNFAASGGAVGSILAAQIWPSGFKFLGTSIYFFFMAVNFTCIPVIYAFYPETKGLALEDMDQVFGKAAAVRDVAIDDLDMGDDSEDEGTDNEAAPLVRSSGREA